jgi:tRNA uracil 4-sulfurtransferase
MLPRINPLEYKNSFVSLLSTGLDSPIATYLIMKQGFDCLALSFLNGKDQGYLNKEKIIKIGKKLVSLTGRKLRIHFVDYDYILDEIKSKCEPKFTCILCKRTMLLSASQIAQHYNAQMIVNGDILGEQASQTLDNLFVVHQINQEIPVIRPLIGFDKLDIIKISQKIGMYDLSLIKGVSCTNNPAHPETRARIKDILQTECNIDRQEIQKTIMNGIIYVDVES